MKLILSILSHHIKSSIELNFSENQQQQQQHPQPHRIHRILIDKAISVNGISNTDKAKDKYRDKINKYNKLTVKVGNRYLVHCNRTRTPHRNEINFKATIKDQATHTHCHNHCHQTHYTATIQTVAIQAAEFTLNYCY